MMIAVLRITASLVAFLPVALPAFVLGCWIEGYLWLANQNGNLGDIKSALKLLGARSALWDFWW